LAIGNPLKILMESNHNPGILGTRNRKKAGVNTPISCGIDYLATPKFRYQSMGFGLFPAD